VPLRIFPEKQMPLAPHQKSWPDIDVSPMVPEEFARFRPLTADALVFFLEHLSEPRLTELVASAPSEAWRFLPGASPGRERDREDFS